VRNPGDPNPIQEKVKPWKDLQKRSGGLVVIKAPRPPKGGEKTIEKPKNTFEDRPETRPPGPLKGEKALFKDLIKPC